ncbi:MAG TPA: right-handed parallel beta-helix repeat-containing protein [Thermoanaerobaculia bacterium]|jgi:parallel beta-helix repeat protein
MSLKRFTATFLFLLVSLSAHATLRYVATTGNDTTGDGSINNPYQSITKAALAVQPGDTVYVRGGVYFQQANIWTDGTASARVTYQPYPNEHVIIDATGQLDGNGNPANAVTIGGDYVDFIGFEVRNAPLIGMLVWGVHDDRILNNVVHDSVRGGIWMGHDNFGRNYNNIIEGNIIRRNVLENVARNWNGGWAQSIGVAKGDNITIRYNTVYRNWGEGIVLGNTDNSKIYGNEVFDNYSVGIYLTQVQTSTVDGNVIYSTGDTNYYRFNEPASGIMLANEDSPTADLNPLNGIDVTNNIIVRGHWGIGFWNDPEELEVNSMTNCRFANNTIYNTAYHALHIDADVNHSGVIVENNIFNLPTGGTGTLTSVPASAPGITYRNNNWSANPGSPAYDATTDVIGAAGFVRPGGLTAEDYKLLSTSICINKGRTLTYVTKDYWLKSRTGTYDIGAHEY